MNSKRNASHTQHLGEQRHSFTPDQYSSWVLAQVAKPCDQLHPRSGFILIVAVTTVTIVGTIIWILNILNILHIPWAAVIGAILSAIGILLALWPLDSQMATQSKNQAMNPATLPYASPRKTALWTRRKRGVLHVKVRKQLRHTTIAIYRGFNQAHRQPVAAASITGRLVEGEFVYIGTFPSVEPGNYTVATQDKEYIALVTIYAGVATWIDWQ